MPAAVLDRIAMTLTIENSSNSNHPDKTGSPSENSSNKPGESPRSNPVCLEISLTIRSLPGELGGLTQPIREEAKTVIVFDNGAVIRSTSNLASGQKIIVSNASGRDVVCSVVGGRNLPNLKGYIEVQFLEPVNDFWNIHKGGDSVAGAAPPPMPLPPMESPVTPTFAPVATTRVSAPAGTPSRTANSPLGTAPTFDDIGGLASMLASPKASESKARPDRASLGIQSKDDSGYDHSENSNHGSVANWRPASPAEKPEIPADLETLSISSAASAAPREFMSKGLMAYVTPESSAGASTSRTPLIIGVAAVALAGICAAVYFRQRPSGPEPGMNMAALTRPATPSLPAAYTAPEPAPSPRDVAAPPVAQTETEPKPVAVDQPQPVAAAEPIPAVVKSAVTSDARTDTREPRRQEKNAVATKQTEPTPARRPTIQNLKMASPSAPNKNSANPGEGASPLTDIAATETVGGAPPAGLLTAAGRASHPPAAPPSAPAPVAAAPAPVAKTVREPKLITSTRPTYPAAAKQSNVQGTVSVVLDIDAAGKVTGAKALSGPLLLRQAALESVQQWKYSPGSTDGKPTASQVTVNLEFRLR